MRLQRHTKAWWYEPSLKHNKVRVPSRLRYQDPSVTYDPIFSHNTTRHGAFEVSRKWVPYNRLQSFDAGYIVPLYTLSEIARRYGLSQYGTRYFRNYILPPPYDIVRRRSVNAYHWSRFVLMGMDVVLKDLENRGYRQFLKSFEDHIDLLHVGVKYMQDYYEQRLDETQVTSTDKFGVQWHDR